MAYRREGERLRVENDELRRELEQARKELEALEGTVRAPAATPVLARLVGGSADATIEGSAPGRLDDAALGAALDQLTRRFDTSGQVVHLGGRFAWSTPPTFERLDDVSVVIEQRDGGVRVRARMKPARLGVGVYALFVGLVLPTGFAVLAALGHLPSLVLVLPLFVLSVLAARWLFATWTARRERAMREVVRSLSAGFAGRARVRVPALVEGSVAERDAEAEAEAEVADAALATRR